MLLMVSNLNHALAGIAKDVLSLLGERAMKGLVSELGLLGISLKPEEFDIIKVDQGLKKIFGSASELFMEQIYVEFKTKLSEEGINNDEIETKDQNVSAAEMISSLLAPKTAL